MDAFKGSYTRTAAEQYEEFLKALDVSFLLRKAATVSTPAMDITEDAGTWSIKTSTTLKTMELKFKVKEPKFSSAVSSKSFLNFPDNLSSIVVYNQMQTQSQGP